MQGRIAGSTFARSTLTQNVRAVLLDMIVERALEPGQHLVAGDLAQDLGVSRQPVREALQQLRNEGWARLRPGQGIFVHQPSPKEADDLLTIRTRLEIESARLAAQHANEQQLAELCEVLGRGTARAEAGDEAAAVAANSDFHQAVAEAAGNQVLAVLSSRVDLKVRWYYRAVASSRGEASWREHAELLEAITVRDGERAARLMHQHTEATRLAYRTATG